MRFGTTGIKANDFVYFGNLDTKTNNRNYSGDDLIWRVLDPDHDNTYDKDAPDASAGAMFLVSEGLVGNGDSYGHETKIRYSEYKFNHFTNKWADTYMPEWCEKFENNAFTPIEQTAVRRVTKEEPKQYCFTLHIVTENIGPFENIIYTSDVPVNSVTDRIENQGVFLPSFNESITYMPNAYHDARFKGKKTDRQPTRTPLTDGQIIAASDSIAHTEFYLFSYDYITSSEAFMFESSAHRDYHLRPAVNIEKSAIVFSYPEGYKEKFPVGSDQMRQVDPAGGETKFELAFEDPARRDFDVTPDMPDQDVIRFTDIQGAKAGAGEYISAIVTDLSGNILYYGRLASCEDGVPETVEIRNRSVVIPVGDEKNYRLFVFSEHYDGKGLSSYVSPLDEIDLIELENSMFYTVDFDLNGRGAPKPETQRIQRSETQEAHVEEPREPVAAGYGFKCWSTDSQGENRWDFSNQVTQSMTLFAQWAPRPYDISYNWQDDDGHIHQCLVENRFYDDGRALCPAETMSGLQKPSSDVAFTGWNTMPDGSGDAFRDQAPGNIIVPMKDGPDIETVQLYAQWTDRFTVSFDTQGYGEAPDDEVASVANEWKVAEPEPPVADGCSLVGWYTEPTCKNKWNFESDVVPCDLTLFAKWDGVPYTVAFDANGGGGQMAAQNRTVADRVELPESGFTPPNSEVLFAGWNTASDGSGRAYAPGFMGDLTTAAGATVTLFAQWSDRFAVTFNLYGQGAPQPEDAWASEASSWKVPEPAEPAAEGYDFGGWWHSTGRESTRWDFEEDIVTGNMELDAAWVPHTYTVSFDQNGGTGSMDPQQRCYNDSEKLPACTLQGLWGNAFAGWNTERNGNGTSFPDQFDGNLTSKNGEHVILYAQWGPSYEIGFDANGGAYRSGDPRMHVRATDGFGDLSVLEDSPDDPPQGGGAFIGWFTDRVNGTEVRPGAHFDGDTVLFAHWGNPSYRAHTITLDPNGGTVSPSEVGTNSDGRLESLPEPEYANHTFAGWYTEREGGTLVDPSAAEKPLFAGDTTLYAHWKGASYTVRFDANGGEGAMTDQARTVGDGRALTKCAFTRASDAFANWNTEPDGSGVPYADGALGDLAEEGGDVVILYAQWGVSYNVTFDSTDGSWANGDKKRMKATGAYGVMEELEPGCDNGPYYYPGRPAAQFEAWWTKPAGGALVQDGAVFASDATLYAHYGATGVRSTVTFDPQGGIVDPTSIATDYNGYLTDAMPTPTGHKGQVFNGWWSEPTGGVRIEEGTRFSSDTTLYARWENRGRTQVCIAVFDLNGHGAPKPAPQMRGVQHGWHAQEPSPAPTEAGYTFGGWFREADCVNRWNFADDVLWKPLTTLYAKWTPHRYTVEFDANAPEGTTPSGTMGEQDRRYDDGLALPACAFGVQDSDDPEAPYVFTGWNTQPDGSGDAFGDQDAQNITEADGETVTLYAQWNSAQITTTHLPKGKQGRPYRAQLRQAGLTGPLTWSVAAGELPEGFALDSATGRISGASEQAGTFAFTVQVQGSGMMGETMLLSKELSIYVVQNDPEPAIFVFIEGMGGSWTKGSDAVLPFKTNGEFAMFEGIQVDGKALVRDADYRAFEGSTAIQLLPDYLETLSAGEHILTALYDDGQQPFTNFTVEASPGPGPSPGPEPDPDPRPEPDPDPDPGPSPDPEPAPDPSPGPEPAPDGNPDNGRQSAKPAIAGTGDSTPLAPLVALALLSACMLPVAAIRKRKDRTLP